MISLPILSLDSALVNSFTCLFFPSSPSVWCTTMTTSPPPLRQPPNSCLHSGLWHHLPEFSLIRSLPTQDMHTATVIFSHNTVLIWLLIHQLLEGPEFNKSQMNKQFSTSWNRLVVAKNSEANSMQGLYLRAETSGKFLDFYWDKCGHCCYWDVSFTQLAGLEPRYHKALTNQIKYLFFAILE